MFFKGRSCEGLGGDVGEVVFRGEFDKANRVALLGVANHGIARGYPFGFVG